MDSRRGTRPTHHSSSAPRPRSDEYGNKLSLSTVEADRRVVEQVASIAATPAVTKAQVALAWIRHKPFITAPIIGAS